MDLPNIVTQKGFKQELCSNVLISVFSAKNDLSRSTEFFFLNLCISDVADCLLCSCMKIYIFSSGASICYELIEAFNSRKIYEVCQVFCPFTVSSSFPTMAKTLISSHLQIVLQLFKQITLNVFKYFTIIGFKDCALFLPFLHLPSSPLTPFSFLPSPPPS